MLKITLHSKNAPAEVVRKGLSTKRAALIALNCIKDAWAGEGHTLHYDGERLFVGDLYTYEIQPE